jgi:hypothetical protein
MAEETKAKISQSNTGKIRPSDWSRHISEAKRGKPSSMKGVPQPSSSYKRSEETKRRMSEGRKRMLAEHPEIMESVSRKLTMRKGLVTNRVISQETRDKMSQSKQRYLREHPEAIERLSDSRRGKPNRAFSRIVKELWRQNYYIPILVEARKFKPNKQEIALGKIIDEVCPGMFKYNGDYSLGIALNRSIPDFVNINGKKQIIEFFGTYWHKQEGRGEDDKVAKYKEVGWNCLVVWDKELKQTDALKNKIRAFVGGKVKLTSS